MSNETPLPAAWIESPLGTIRANPLYKVIAPQSAAWSIPLYAREDIDRLTAENAELRYIAYRVLDVFQRRFSMKSLEDETMKLRAALNRSATGAGGEG